LTIAPSRPVFPLKADPLVPGKSRDNSVQLVPQAKSLQLDDQSVTLDVHEKPNWQKLSILK
jgi:hypothetical protein